MKELVFKLLYRLANWLPRRIALAIGSGFGITLYHIINLTKFKNVLQRNIQTAFPKFSDEQTSQIAKQHARDLLKTIVEVMRFRDLPSLLKKDLIKTKGFEIIEDILSQEKGAILLSGHFGNWEFLICVMGLLGYPVHAIVLRQSSTIANKLLVQERERFGSKVIYAQEISTEQIKDILSHNGLILLLADHHHYSEEAKNIVEFFNKPVSVPGGPVAYSLKFDVPLIPIYTIREPGDQYLITVERPVPLIRTGDMKKNFLKNCRLYMKVYETWIQTYPDQWMWSHERWAWLDENLQSKIKTRKAENND